MGEYEGENAKVEEHQNLVDALARLEENLRELHDRLNPVLREEESETENSEAPKRPPMSPLSEKVAIISELIRDIDKRLEL